MLVVQNVLLQRSVPILNELVSKKLPIKTAYKILKLVKAANDKLETYEQTRRHLSETCLKRDENDNPIPATDEHGNVIEGHFQLEDPQRYQEEMNELNEMMVDIDADPIDIDELGNDVTMDANSLNVISWAFGLD